MTDNNSQNTSETTATEAVVQSCENPDFESTGEPKVRYVERKMAFICSKGNLDMAYPALIMAHAALDQGIHVDIFFTFWGLDIVDKRTMDSLKFTMQANTAMHMPALEKLHPGWGTRYIPPSLGVLPGMTTFATKYFHREIKKIEIPTVRDLLEQVAEMGADMWACKMTADMMQIKPKMLHPAVRGIIDAGAFIELSEGAQIIFI